tara:strand:- start:4321 stop:4707 length:387 start_codon:yes stop_codon:yes gene_type:complete
MSWKKKSKKNFSNTKRKDYSLSRKLRREGRSSSELEVAINSLSLEEIIGLKLEIATRSAGGLLYGLPLWYSLPLIIKEAILMYAISACKTNMEAARFLGIDKVYLSNLLKKYDIDQYFEKNSLTKKDK